MATVTKWQNVKGNSAIRRSPGLGERNTSNYNNKMERRDWAWELWILKLIWILTSIWDNCWGHNLRSCVCLNRPSCSRKSHFPSLDHQHSSEDISVLMDIVRKSIGTGRSFKSTIKRLRTGWCSSSSAFAGSFFSVERICFSGNLQKCESTSPAQKTDFKFLTDEKRSFF